MALATMADSRRIRAVRFGADRYCALLISCYYYFAASLDDPRWIISITLAIFPVITKVPGGTCWLGLVSIHPTSESGSCRKRGIAEFHSRKPGRPHTPSSRVTTERPYKKRRGEDSNLRRQPRPRRGLRGRCIQPLSATSPEEKIAYILGRRNRRMTHIYPGAGSIPRESEKSSSRKPAVSTVATYRITSHPGEYRSRY